MSSIRPRRAAKIQAAALLLIGPYIMVIAETGRIETFPERAFSSGDLSLLGPLMKDFIAGGIRGMLETPRQQAARPEGSEATAPAARRPVPAHSVTNVAVDRKWNARYISSKRPRGICRGREGG